MNILGTTTEVLIHEAFVMLQDTVISLTLFLIPFAIACLVMMMMLRLTGVTLRELFHHWSNR